MFTSVIPKPVLLTRDITSEAALNLVAKMASLPPFILILFIFLHPILSHAKCPSNTTLSPAQTTAIPQFSLATAYSQASAPQDPKAVGQILNTLSFYPLAIDGKNFAALSLVFAEDVTTNYSEPLNVLTPLSTVKEVLEMSLRPVTSQHSYGTQIVELLGECEARSVSYFTVTHFGIGKYVGQVSFLQFHEDVHAFLASESSAIAASLCKGVENYTVVS